jgi:signal transduction histidine kinase
MVDEKALIRAIRNIVENAQKFSKHQTRAVEVSAQLVGSMVQIDVTDFGIGMSPDEASKVFEMFYRADSSRVRETGGYGLGLPLAKSIVQAHGGNLQVLRSAPENGSTFRIELPLVP